MTPMITTDKAAIQKALRFMREAANACNQGQYKAAQAVVAMPAALNLVEAIIPALYELETRQEMKRKEYEALYEGEELPASLAEELKQRAGKIAAIRFALAKAGCVDVAPVKEAA